VEMLLAGPKWSNTKAMELEAPIMVALEQNFNFKKFRPSGLLILSGFLGALQMLSSLKLLASTCFH